MCRVLKVSKSGYYESIKRKPSKRQLENEAIKAEIIKVHKESRQRYGSPKITKYMRFKGWAVSRPRVARIMRSEGIRSIVNKKFRCTTTDSNPLKTDKINIIAAVPTAIPPTAIPEMILIAFVDFFANTQDSYGSQGCPFLVLQAPFFNLVTMIEVEVLVKYLHVFFNQFTA